MTAEPPPQREDRVGPADDRRADALLGAEQLTEGVDRRRRRAHRHEVRSRPHQGLHAPARTVPVDAALGAPPVQAVRRHAFGDLRAGVRIPVEDPLDRRTLGLTELANRHCQHGYQIAR
jgi:hypothetical protein